MKIYNCEQKSDEWHALRREVLTASKFEKVLTRAEGDLKKSYTEFMADLATGALPLDPHEEREREILDRKFDIQWGNDHEDEAREWFAENVMPITEVGFIKPHNLSFLGCSPDGLIPDGSELGKWYAGVEIKCPKLKTFIKWVLAKKLPDEHRLQVHGNMAVTRLDIWYFMAYFPGYRPFVLEVKRDTFTKKVEESLKRFEREYIAERDRIFDAILFKESEVAA